MQDRPVFEALRTWRKEEAQHQQVPVHAVAGVGRAKLERYGEDVLRVVRNA